MNKSAEIKDLAKALSLAQTELLQAHKEKTNPFFKSKYADLESVWDAIRGPLTKNGLSVVQTTDWDAECETVIVTTLMHLSGQWIEGRLPIMAAKKDPQGVGSAITYARRYALAAIVGVVQVDDDGNKATHGTDAPVEWAKMTGSQILAAQTQPGATSTAQSLASEYVIPFGKLKGLKVGVVPIKELESYKEWLIKNSAKDGKPLSSNAKEFISAVDDFIEARSEQLSSELDGDLPF